MTTIQVTMKDDRLYRWGSNFTDHLLCSRFSARQVDPGMNETDIVPDQQMGRVTTENTLSLS